MSCNYQGHEFGASYLDSVCIDGFLWDVDSGNPGEPLMNGGDIPCPVCDPVGYAACRFHDNETGAEWEHLTTREKGLWLVGHLIWLERDGWIELPSHAERPTPLEIVHKVLTDIKPRDEAGTLETAETVQ